MMVPHRTPFFLPALYPSSLKWRVHTQARELFLTFDDGPVNGPTEFVLDTLRQFNAKATFFCIGDNVRKHQQVFDAILNDGHIVGNHTYHHLNGWKTATAEYLDNVMKCEEVLGASGNGRRRLFRPPYGRITRSQIRSLGAFDIIMWDVLAIDYDQRLSPEKCLKNTLAATRSGSIIVFHDSVKAEQNMTFALPRMLDHFSSLGFTFNSLM